MSDLYKDINTVVVGSINMDIVFGMERVPDTGENLLGTTYSYAFGGKGANQATALAKLGANVRMVGKVADDTNGAKLIKNLEYNNVDTSFVDTTGSQTGLAAILIDGEGRNRIVVYEGANKEIEPNEAIKGIDDTIDLLLVQFETAEDVVIKSVNQAIEKNITTVIDCGPAKSFNLEAMQGATIISPNESECLALTGISPDNEDNILKASKKLMARSLAKYVVLKLGERGCAIFDGNDLSLLPAYKTTVADTTAAGDCFTAAMALEYRKSKDIFKACDLGNKAGAYAVSKLGAQSSMPSLEELL